MFPLYATLRPRRFPIVNWMLISLNGILFYYELKLGDAGLYRFIQTWGLIPFQLASNPAETWVTIFTSMFLHGGWFHILSNMWFLAIFGDNIEDRLGGGRYLDFLFIERYSSRTAAGISSHPASDQPMIGASGAIAGVLGAYLILFPRARIVSLVPIFLFLHLLKYLL